jgi:hypothetical protein
VNFVVVEQHPAQRFHALVLVRGCELAGDLRKMGQDHAGLAELASLRLQHRGFTHLVDALAPFGFARRPLEEIDERRLPVEAGAVKVKRGLVGVSGLAESSAACSGPWHGIPWG